MSNGACLDRHREEKLNQITVVSRSPANEQAVDFFAREIRGWQARHGSKGGYKGKNFTISLHSSGLKQ
jgi:hypothetical protein